LARFTDKDLWKSNNWYKNDKLPYNY